MKSLKCVLTCKNIETGDRAVHERSRNAPLMDKEQRQKLEPKTSEHLASIGKLRTKRRERTFHEASFRRRREREWGCKRRKVEGIGNGCHHDGFLYGAKEEDDFSLSQTMWPWNDGFYTGWLISPQERKSLVVFLFTCRVSDALIGGKCNMSGWLFKSFEGTSIVGGG